ncbi:MAG TPA: hypothetical protein DHV65_12420, partial [Ktedonobacter sp.]|nr:hypothetical protein [Ktedonobacter sp.]
MHMRRVNFWLPHSVVGLTLLLSLLVPARASAQTPGAAPLTLNDAVQLALKNYPAMAESRARAEAAEAAVDVAKTAYLPRLDAVWQENRATANNVYGILLPQSIIPSLTGPVLRERSYDLSLI